MWNNQNKKSLTSNTRLFESYIIDSVGKYSQLWIWILNFPDKFCPICLIFQNPFSKGFHLLGPNFLNCCHMSFSVYLPPYPPPQLFFFKRKASGLYHEGLLEAVGRGWKYYLYVIFVCNVICIKAKVNGY